MVFLSCPGRTRSGGTFFLTCPDLLLSSRPCLLLTTTPAAYATSSSFCVSALFNITNNTERSVASPG
jgi:hypothetical protein